MTSTAQESSVSPPDIASKILVALEQKVILERQIATGDLRINELKIQLELVNSKIVVMQDIINLQNEKIELYKSNNEIQKKLDEGKDKLHQQELDSVKPTFWQNMTKYITGGGIGAVLTVIAIVLL